MLPYFIFTEEIQGFCELMGYSIENGATHAKYVCMYSLHSINYPLIAIYELDPKSNPYIPNEKVIAYLSCLLDGYSYADAVKEVGVVWG